MHIDITFRHMDSSEALKRYVEEKMEGFSRFLHEPVEVHVVLSVQKLDHSAEVTVTAKDYKFHAVESAEKMYASIDLVSEKIERQLVKHKEKIKDHKH